MAEGRITDPKAFAAFMLEKTSRTFALNIQVLPPGLRRQVLLAYLFCRMADTLEDDAELDEAAKTRLLESFRGLFAPGAVREARAFEGRIASFRAGLPPEWGLSDRWDRLLVHHCHWILPQLADFPVPAVDAIAKCVDEMCSGMIDFTRRQARTRDGQVLIETVADLDRYCYYVAGTVGNLLCELFTLHSPLIGALSFFVSLLTGVYMFRLYFLVFAGSPHGSAHAHESPWTMTLPLVLLALAPAALGVAGRESN